MIIHAFFRGWEYGVWVGHGYVIIVYTYISLKANKIIQISKNHKFFAHNEGHHNYNSYFFVMVQVDQPLIQFPWLWHSFVKVKDLIKQVDRL